MLSRGGVSLILAFLTSTVKAKNLPSLPSSYSVENDLSDRLAEDKDFQAYAIATYEFILKVRETKEGNLLVKYFNQVATLVERKKLATILGYDSEESLKSFLINVYQLKTTLNKKFTELQEFTKHQLQIRKARSKAAFSVLKPQHTTEDCWDLFFTISTLCSTTCLAAPDWSTCWVDCFAGLGGLTTLCLITAD